MPFSKARGICCAFVLMVSLLLAPAAKALPSFARQTGLPCQTCHTIAFGPALTPYGQQFKLNGYTWGSADNPFPPLAFMQVSSFTHTAKGQEGGAGPGFKANDNVAADQTSLFYGGRIAGPVGAFVQTTYDGVADRAAWDNIDIRFAQSGQFAGVPLVYGLSLNNSPTVQDLWNSTPAWSYPYESSPLAPTPTAAALIEEGLAQQVAGLTAYTQVNGWLYLEGGAYRNLPPGFLDTVGVEPEGLNTVRGFAPYWRAAVQKQIGALYASLGTFGLHASLRPGGDRSAGTDRYTDLGFDATFQYQASAAHAFNGNATFIHENQHLDASFALGGAANRRDRLEIARFNAAYVWKQTVSLSSGPFFISGNKDSGLYAPADISGSRNGSPDSRGVIWQLEYVPFGKADSFWRPWLNARFGLQYTQYFRFNGANHNFDGSGRNAGDNDTLYFFVWIAG